ncbi:TonB-dependent receptor [Sphingomonas sp. MMS24-J13]|uniref:TonB-dependent receptor n=1 Tax=Sphingomonas sp. MMS24-J13 TaxID=3238686 RepID=UPI00384E69E3
MAPATQAAVAASGANAPVDEIVVTAQFRSQNLQNTPLAITALNAASLEARGATQAADLTNTAPNLLFKQAGASYGPAAQVFIRGIGQQDSSFASEPGVGTYIDDVYYGTLYGANFDLLDLDRIEILRGPQGTLAGKNSIGGSLKLYTHKPDGRGDAFVEGTYGTRNLASFRGGADIVMVPDRLFARISGVFNRQDGYVRRMDYGCLHPGGGVAVAGTSQNCTLGREGGKNYGGGRVALRWLPTAGLEINLNSTLIRDTSEPAPTVLTGVTSAANAYFGGLNPNIFVTNPRDYINYATYTAPAFTDPATYAGKVGAGNHPTTTVPDHNDILNSATAATIDLSLPHGLSIKSITGYTYTRAAYGVDMDSTPVAVQNALYAAKSRQFSQELRLSGDAFGDLVDWTVGGYYYRAHNNFSGSNILYAGLPFENLNSPDDDIISRNKSGFGQIIVHPLDRLNVTGGIRYTDDAKSYVYRRFNPFLPGVPTFTPAGALTGVHSDYHATRVDYRVNVDYRWSDSLMTYAQISTGFRGGGTNARPFVPEQAVSFNPETLTAYEIGLKSDLFDRKLRLNAAGFINDYNNMIFTNVAPTPTSINNATPTNVGKGQFKGAEIEITARPFDGLLIDASGSYLDFKLKSFTSAGVVIAGVTLDSKAPFSPKWKAAVGVQYAVGTAIGTLTPRIDYAYQSSFFTNIDNNPLGAVPGYGLFNAKLTWDSPDRAWRLSATVKNMFNRFYYVNKFFNVGLQTTQPAPPREWMLTLRRKL